MSLTKITKGTKEMKITKGHERSNSFGRIVLVVPFVIFVVFVPFGVGRGSCE